MLVGWGLILYYLSSISVLQRIDIYGILETQKDTWTYILPKSSFYSENCYSVGGENLAGGGQEWERSFGGAVF